MAKEADLIELEKALERLKRNKPVRVKVGSKISKDSVALEAGLARGAIRQRNDRDNRFKQLIENIEEVKAQVGQKATNAKFRIERLKEECKSLDCQLEAALEREFNLYHLVAELKLKLSKLTGQNVFPLRPEPQSDL